MKEKLYVYIDESGDTGLKINEGSSSFFVVALVIVNKSNLEKLSKSIEKIIKSINVKGNEMKFFKTTLKNKVLFFNKIRPLEFRSEIFVFNKNSTKLNYENCIIFCLRQVLIPGISYSVFLDGLNKKSFSGKSVNSARKLFDDIDRIYLMDSKKSYLIQLADMLAGLANSVHKGKINYNLILHHLEYKIKITHIE